MKVISFSAVLSLLAPSASLALTPNQAAAQVLAQARDVIANLVRADWRLTPEFLRMGFHDCVGGCDGCIDLSDSSNNGLAHPISVLEPVVATFVDGKTKVTRADIWALAATVAADVVDHGNATAINFTQNWYGRQTCEQANAVCKNSAGVAVLCSATAGPARTLPPPTLNSKGVFGFFADNFGFNERQTVAIMGAHNVGRALKTESGIDGPDGWTINNVVLQNHYYQALMGGINSASEPSSTVGSKAPSWVQKFQNNAGIGTPNRYYYTLGAAGKTLIMLDTDIALVRELNASNMDTDTGAVTCKFKTSCPLRPTWQDAADFAGNNDLWLNEFKSVLDIMLTNGYPRVPCSDSVCPLFNETDTPAPSSMPVQTVYTPAPTVMTVKTLYTPSPTVVTVQTVYTPAPTVVTVQTVYTPAPTVVAVQTVYTPAPTAVTVQTVYTPAPTVVAVQTVYTPAPTTTPIQTVYTPQPTQKPTGAPISSRMLPTPPTKPPTPPPTMKPTKQPTPPPTKSPSPPPTPRPTHCVGAWYDCTFSPDSCCDGLTCIGPDYWKLCHAPTPAPTPKPTKSPTAKPTRKPTNSPTPKPTKSPTAQPTLKPTKSPTQKPTKSPTASPTPKPTKSPTAKPTLLPTKPPTPLPTKTPTAQPTLAPSKPPTTKPTIAPSKLTPISSRIAPSSPTTQTKPDGCQK